MIDENLLMDAFKTDVKKCYAEFCIFLDKVIKMSFLIEEKKEKKREYLIELGIVYDNFTVSSSFIEDENVFFKKGLDEYLKILSLKEINSDRNMISLFLENPASFSNYIFFVKKEKNIKDVIETIFTSQEKTFFFVYNKPVSELEKLFEIFPEKSKKRIFVKDLANLISPIQYNKKQEIQQKLSLLKDTANKIFTSISE